MAEPRKLALTQGESHALRMFVREVQQTFPARIHQLAIFGSKARGDSDPDSDIDVFVLVDREDRAFRTAIIDIASQISLDCDVLLSPRIIGEERWKKMRGFTLYQNVLRDAIRLSLEGGQLALAPGIPQPEG